MSDYLDYITDVGLSTRVCEKKSVNRLSMIRF